jgi:hypothetical protein
MIERRRKYSPESEIFKIGISEQRSGGVLDGATPKLNNKKEVQQQAKKQQYNCKTKKTKDI